MFSRVARGQRQRQHDVRAALEGEQRDRQGDSGRAASPFSSISTWTGEQSKPVAWNAIVCLMLRPPVPCYRHPRAHGSTPSAGDSPAIVTHRVGLARREGRWLDAGLSRRGALDRRPGVRWGEGLFETMRAEGGRVALLDRHLDRLRGVARRARAEPRCPAASAMRARPSRRSLAALGRGPGARAADGDPAPDPARGGGARRARWPRAPGRGARDLAARRLVAGRPRSPSTRASPTPAPGAPSGRAERGRRRPRAAARRATAAWARRRCATSSAPSADEVVTAPADGAAAAASRGPRVLESVPARAGGALDEDAWRAAREIVLTNAVRGAMAVVAVDGAPVGDGRPGRWPRDLHAVLRDALRAGARLSSRAAPRRGRSATVATRRPSRRIALRPRESFSRSSVFAMSSPDSSAMRSSRYRTVWRCV